MKTVSRRPGRLATVLATAATMAAMTGLTVPAANAAETTISDATLKWGLSEEAGGGAYFGGCNFLSAGTAGDSGSARVWTEGDGFYKNQDGNVSILKDGPNGEQVTPTWDTKCLGANEEAVKPWPGSSTHNQVQLSGGTGSTDAQGTTTVTWDGSFTVVFYGGLTYWSATNPTLTVQKDGKATLTATASGYGASMEDLTKWEKLEPRTIDLANFSTSEVADNGFSGTPDYRGVTLTGVDNQTTDGANWGAFPQSYIDFQLETGQSSYWYSSGGTADPKKIATPLDVAWTSATTDPADDNNPGDGATPGDGKDINIDVTVPEAHDDDDNPGHGDDDGAFSWEIAGASASLGSATQTDAGSFKANGNLPTITVTDTRKGTPSWTLNGDAKDFASGANTFKSTALGWNPAVKDNDAGVRAGDKVAAGNPGFNESKTLASAPAGHKAGKAEVGASLELLAPKGTKAGNYTSTMTITALGE